MARKGEETREDDELETGAARVYELGFHLDPELPAEEVKRAYQSIRETITEKGTIVAEGEPLMVQLAYTVSRQETAGRRDFDAAYFAWIAYEMPAVDHDEVLSAAHADKRIFRFIDVLTTKDAARHAAEMREIALKVPTAKVEDADEEEAETPLETAAA